MKSKNVYSPYKVMNYIYKIEQLKNGELPIPVFVQWDLTNKCNLNCSFCFYRQACSEDGYQLTDWDVNDEMPVNVVMRTLKELSDMGVKAIEWTGGGSIECYSNYKSIFAEAKRLGFKQSLVTNGTLLDAEALELIKDFEWVRFSVDASTQETYKKIKGADKFNDVIFTIKDLVKISKPENIIGLSFIVCPDNCTEILDAATLAKSLGCNNVRFSLAMSPKRDKLFVGIWDDCVKQMEEASRLQDDKFRVFAFSNRINALRLSSLSEYCGYHHLVAVIAPRGVYPCCRLKNDSEYRLGDLNTETFKEIWFGEKRKDFIKSIEKGCPYDCWMTNKNNFIQYLKESNGMHKEFI